MESLSVDSVLDAVTVYEEGAICRRLAKVPVREGAAARVRLHGLPLSLLEGSLRASIVSGPPELRVRDVRPGFEVSLPSESEVPPDEKALEAAEDRVQQLEAERDRVQREIVDVSGLKPSNPPRDKGELPRASRIESTLALANFVDERLRELHAKRRELESALEDGREEVELQRRRVRESSSAVRRERAQLIRTAVVTLGLATGAGEVELAVEYLVPGAAWVPAYELKLDRSLSRGALTMRASVAQRTGEDWKGVKLSLSTARLDRRIEVPELASLRIGKSQPAAPRSGWRDPPPGLAELFSGFDAAHVSQPLPPAHGGRPLPRMPEPIQAQMPDGAVSEALIGGMDDDEDEATDAGFGSGSRGGSAKSGAVSMERADMRRAGGPGGGGMPKPSGAPRPPPAPPMASMSMAAPPASAPMAQPAPKASRAMAKKRAPMKDKGMAREEEESLAPPPELDEASGVFDDASRAPAEVELSSGLLDYGRLVMAGPEEGGARGKLRPANVGEAWELDVYTRVSVRVDVETLVRMRRREAQAVSSLARPAHAGDVRAAAGSYDYRFDSERRVDVVADGVWHTVTVCGADTVISPEYVCVPSVDPKVYRTVKLRNASRHALLAGPVDVTLGDEFLMTVPMPTLAPGGEERVGLGVEEGIKVSRNTRFSEAAGGLFGGAAVLEHGVDIEVANRLARAVDVEVLERVPVTSDKDIKVEESAVQPPWATEVRPRDGALVEGSRVWRLKLEANATKKLSAQYAIRIPSQKVLVGGNRRV